MPLRQRKFGAPPLHVSELALGTWGLSGEGYGPVANDDADATIKRAVELGVTLFETSDAYGKGSMEERLGRLLEPHQATTFVATRHGVDRSVDPPQKCFTASYLAAAFARTQERLRRGCVDIYLLHNPGVATLTDPDVIGFLKELQATGKVRAWGVSAGDVEVAHVAIAAGAKIISMAYNVLFHADVHDVIGPLAQAGAGLLAHSVLGYGQLAGLWPPSKTFLPGDHRADRWSAKDLTGRRAHLDAVRSLMGGEVATMRAAALRYVLANHVVTSAVLGPRNVGQLEQLVREAGDPPYLEVDKLGRLPSRMVSLGLDP